MAAESVGALSRIGINSTRLCYSKLLDHSVLTLTDAGDETMCGALDHHAELVDVGPKVFKLDLVSWPTPEELDIILPLLGYTESPTDTFTITGTIPSFTLVVDRVAKVHTYATCYVDKYIFRGQEGKTPVSLQMSILGTSVTEGTSFTPSAPTRTAPYAFQRGALTLLSGTRLFKRFAWACDHNMLAAFYNSATASYFSPTDRQMYLGMSTPYTSSETDILTAGLDDDDRVAGADDLELVFTRGGQSTGIAIANGKWETNLPHILGKRDAINLDMYWKCYRTAATALAVVTHDATA